MREAIVAAMGELRHEERFPEHARCRRPSDVVVGKGETKFNFCPKCGSPLNFKAGTFEEKKLNREKLKLLYEIVDECENDYENKLKQCIKELEEEI